MICKSIFLGAIVVFLLSVGETVYGQIGVITTIAGIGSAGFSGDSAAAIYCELNSPTNITLDEAGNVYISDTRNQKIRKLHTATGHITTIVGADENTQYPRQICIDAEYNIYVAASFSYRIRIINPSGWIGTVAGISTYGFSGDNRPATIARLNMPSGVALDTAGNLYIADKVNQRIRKVAKATGIITTIAGTGIAGYSGDNGAATNATFNYPTSLAIDKLGNIFVADNNNHCIRKINEAGIIVTVAGNGVLGYSGDGGPATTAQFYNPEGVAIDDAGNLFIADLNNNCVRMVNNAGTITTVAGNGRPGFSGDGGIATNAKLHFPSGIAVDNRGSLYIADQHNNRIRKVILPTAIESIAANNSISIYPNPVTEILNINTGNLSYSTLLISNYLGAMVGKYQLRSSDTKIDIHELPSGVYNITLVGKDGEQMSKFIKR